MFVKEFFIKYKNKFYIHLMFLPLIRLYLMRTVRTLSSSMRFQARKKLLVMFCCTFCLSANATDETYIFDIPTLKVEEALGLLTVQTGRQLLFSYELVDSLDSSSVLGEYTLESALNLLLQGTGLSGSLTERGVILITPINAQNKAQKGRESMNKNNLFIGVAATLAAVFGSGVNAQANDAGIDSEVLEEIVVFGVRDSVIKALSRKRDSAVVLDSIEAEDLGKFPDINLAESLQRVPGVSLERSFSGGGRTLTVRGLSSQFSRVEINGMGGASGGGGRSARIDSATSTAGQDGRNFNFDIIPTELFTSAVVSKSPTASDSSGGIASVVKLSTPSPFDLEEQIGSFSLQGNKGEEGSIEPRISGLFSKQVSDQFAFLIGGTYSESETHTSQIGFDRYVSFSTITSDAAGSTAEELAAFAPRGYSYIARERETENLSGLLTLNWRPTDRVDIKFDAFYAASDGLESEAENFIDLTTGVPAPTSLTVENGVATAGEFDSFRRVQVQNRSDDVDDTLQQYTLLGDVEINDTWSIKPFIGYNKREISRPFNEINYFAGGGSDSVSFNLTGGVDNISTSLTDFSSNPDDFILGNILQSINESNSDELEFKVDFVGEFDSTIRRVKVGVRHNQRDSGVNEPFRGAISFFGGPTLGDVLSLQGLSSGGLTPGQIFGVDDIPSTTFALLGNQSVLDPNFDLSLSAASNLLIGSADGDRLAASEIEEDTLAAYIEADLEVGNLTANLGLRYVTTDQTSSGAQSIDGVVSDISVDNDTDDLLPSVNLRYEASTNLFLRATWSKALTRPSLQDISPRETINFVTLTGARGNPGLSPFTVDQYDLGAEWYFHEEGLLGFTFFSKDFESVIATETVNLERIQESTSGGPMTQTVAFNQPVNVGSGEVEGFEVTAQSSLHFLPGDFFANSGVIFNYTDLESSVTDSDGFFPNLSPSSYNGTLYYDDGTFDARLVYSWREGFLRDGFDPDGNFFRQEDFGVLGLTANYQFSDNVTLQFQANNLLDEELEFSSSSREVNVRRLELERRIVFGVRYQF